MWRTSWASCLRSSVSENRLCALARNICEVTDSATGSVLETRHYAMVGYCTNMVKGKDMLHMTYFYTNILLNFLMEMYMQLRNYGHEFSSRARAARSSPVLICYATAVSVPPLPRLPKMP